MAIPSADLVAHAQAVATKAHAGQFRKDGRTPFIEHPRAVAQRVAGDFIAETVAWLHDVVEDTQVTADDLRREGFPDEVVDAVVVLTREPGISYEAFVERAKSSPLTLKVKTADLLANLSDRPTPQQIVKYARALLQLHA